MFNQVSLPLLVLLLIGLEWASRQALQVGDRILCVAIGTVAIAAALLLAVFLQVSPI